MFAHPGIIHIMIIVVLDVLLFLLIVVLDVLGGRCPEHSCPKATSPPPGIMNITMIIPTNV